MKVLKSNLRNMVLSLGGISLIVAAVLAGVHIATSGPIAESEQKAKEAALSAVLPQFANNPGDDAKDITLQGDSKPVKVYPGYDAGGGLTGIAVESYTMDGFSGEIDVLVGFDADGALNGYQILSSAETPGLGAKAQEWFSDKTGHRSVLGSTQELSVSKDGGTVDAITAATITSRAFLQAINRARKAMREFQNLSKK